MHYLGKRRRPTEDGNGIGKNERYMHMMKIQGEMGGKEILRKKIIFYVPFLFLQDIKHQFEKHFVTLGKKISAGEK